MAGTFEVGGWSHFLWVVVGVLAGFLLVGLWNSFVGNNFTALKAS